MNTVQKKIFIKEVKMSIFCISSIGGGTLTGFQSSNG
jgi:hypothetical protein